MEKLNPLHIGAAAAITTGLFNALCAVAFALWPAAALDFIGAFMHGLDVNVVKATVPLGLGRALYGIVGVGLVGFVVGLIFATALNLVGRR